MPPMRLALIDYLAQHPNSFTTDVRRGINKPLDGSSSELYQAANEQIGAPCDIARMCSRSSRTNG